MLLVSTVHKKGVLADAAIPSEMAAEDVGERGVERILAQTMRDILGIVFAKEPVAVARALKLVL